jgi:hypothetical protein
MASLGRQIRPLERRDEAPGSGCHPVSICPEMGTDIQIGPTGQKLLPLAVV